VFDFDFQRHSQLAEVSSSASHQAAREARVQALFFEAVRMEERGKTQEAVAHYQSILALDSSHAPACINLGTIQYNQRQFIEAESLYRRATIADPKYALAFFDLGNVLDELQRLPEAIAAYTTAIHLVPQYGDAHYNVALAYERTGDRRAALRHWTMYIKLDPIGPWSNHARIQARKILEREKLAIVHRGSSARHDSHSRRMRNVPRLLAVPKPVLPM
jgi:tetratricopeptide (TPR) repeat protein